MKTDFLIPAVLCLAVSAAVAAGPEGGSLPSMLAQAEPTPNALDAQDRVRDERRERKQDDVRRRLGDRTPEPTTTGQGFTAPSTDYAPDVPNAGPRTNQNRER